MRPLFASFALLLALAVGAAAQQPPPPAATPPAAAEAAASPESILDQLEPPPGGFSYNPQGRRDPFVSLQKPVSASEKSGPRRAGMEGFLIQEVALKGIVRTPKGFTAMILGTDGKSYFVSSGQRLFDGVITEISATTVTFRQEVTDPLSQVKTREVKKSLYASEEARQ